MKILALVVVVAVTVLILVGALINAAIRGAYEVEIAP